MTRSFARTAWISALILVSITVAGCSPSGDIAVKKPDVQSENLLRDLVADEELNDAAVIIAALEELPLKERPAKLVASVLPRELVLQPGSDDERRVAMGGKFYLSLAPFVNHTHPCTFHSLTSCRGEMSGEKIALRVTDLRSGETILQEERTTQDNGFTGLWLPRDAQFRIAVDSPRGSGSVEATTGDGDPTCITTLRLS